MTATLEVAPAPPGFTLEYKQYLDDVLWQRITCRIVDNYGHSPELAERILNQAIAFLLLCGQSEGESYSPSKLVDHGWHMFMEYQRPLEQFCKTHCGRMVYHNPHDDPRVNYSARTRVDTVQALRDKGFSVDEALWVKAGDCGDNGGCDGYCGESKCSA